MPRESLYKRYQIAITPPPGLNGKSYWLAFSASKILLRIENGSPSLPLLSSIDELALTPVRTQYLGTLNGCGCYSAELPSGTVTPSGTDYFDLRSLWGNIDDDLYLLAGRALQIVSWDRSNQFCGKCGRSTVAVPGERARKCLDCGLLLFPRLSPAVITAITDGDRILLGHRAGFRNMYTIIAGFVEPGETLEECLKREVFEEVGVRVKNIRYFGSQPWPYPDSLMIGFTAEYEGGDIKVDGVEVSEAGWYTAGNLPEIPPKMSIAREMIDWFIGQHPQQ
jgi:NAD+ diphosphatase